MTTLSNVWKQYNVATNRLSEELARTNNLVGEYAEHLINQHIDGKLLNASSKSADIVKDSKRYQVKSRRLSEGTTTSLGIIRSWDFDVLAVILFDLEGNIKKASLVPAAIAKNLAVGNDLQNGYVITTNRNFFKCRMHSDITDNIKRLNGEIVNKDCDLLCIQSRTLNKLYKIKNWAKYPEYMSHKIIRAFLKLDQKDHVTSKNLQKLCSHPISEPSYYVENFIQNYNSMKTNAGNSNGKVFFEDSGSVFLFPQALDEIKKYFPKEYLQNSWPFDKHEEHLAMTFKDIMNGERPILYVHHQKKDADWLFTNHDSYQIDDVSLVHMSDIVDLDPSVLDISYMPPGYHAVRYSVDDEWIVSEVDYDNE